MGSDDSDEASQPVQRLEHRRDECGVAAVAWENLADRGFNPADQFLGFLPLLIGHVRFPSASGGREPVQSQGLPSPRSVSASTILTEEKISDFPAAGHHRQARPRPGDALVFHASSTSTGFERANQGAPLHARVAVTFVVDARRVAGADAGASPDRQSA